MKDFSGAGGQQLSYLAALIPALRKSIRRELIGLFVILVSPHICVYAQEQRISQMLHTSWTARDGAPQLIEALAQTPDGLLWIGSDGGLFSFDGLEFASFASPPGEPTLPASGVSSLCAAMDGSLWVGMQHAGIVHLALGHVTLDQKTDSGVPINSVTNIRQAPDGNMWALVNAGKLVTLTSAGLWRLQEPPSALRNPYLRGFFFDSSNTLWATAEEGLYRRAAGQKDWSKTAITIGALYAYGEMADKSLWLADVDASSDRGRRQHIDPQGTLLVVRYDSEEVEAALSAPDGSIWVALQSGGLQKLRWGEDLNDMKRASVLNQDVYTHLDGLSSLESAVLLRDKEGNVWAGGTLGLDRFTPARLVRAPLGPAEADWSFCAAPDGTVWIANSSKHLFAIARNQVTEVPRAGDIEYIFCERDGKVVVQDHAGLWSVNSGRPRKMPPLPRAIPYAVPQLIQLEDGSMIAVNGPYEGLWLYKNGRWSPFTVASLRPGSPSAMVLDSQQRLWLSYGLSIYLVENGIARRVAAGLEWFGIVRVFIATSKGMMAAAAGGVAILRNGDLQVLKFADAQLGQGVTGMVQAPNGDIWLNGRDGIVRLPSSEVDAALANPRYLVRAESVREGPFVGPAPSHGIKNSALVDASGKVWFATINGIVSVDPQQAKPSSTPPVLAIRSITADGRPLANKDTFPPQPQRLSIQYLGVNLTRPAEVVYRYRLIGLDETWQQVGHQTEAIYTHLRPGKYSFAVEASNGDGAWTAPVQSLSFAVLPTFYQTWWFLALVAVLLLVVVWSLIALRIRSIAAAVRQRAEERIDERVRIARDLHDTLLQGVHMLLITFHLATERLPPEHEARLPLHRALSSAEKIILEGRDQVTRLRMNNLTDEEMMIVLKNTGAALNLKGEVQYTVERLGSAIKLTPAVAEEIFYVAREAVCNAFKHSGATAIEVRLHFEKKSFLLTCRDNGRGFDLMNVRQNPQQGHWGLRGMQERAARIGSKLACNRGSAGGTEVILEVPSRTAYAQDGALRSFIAKRWPIH